MWKLVLFPTRSTDFLKEPVWFAPELTLGEESVRPNPLRARTNGGEAGASPVRFAAGHRSTR